MFLVVVLLCDGFTITSTQNYVPREYSTSSTHLLMQRSSIGASIPPPPLLKRASLPTMLAGGLFLFATSVPSSQRKFANELLDLSEEALRSDPTIVMELGMGVEAGGIYASSYVPYHKERTLLWGKNVDRMVLQFQINGGNAWAQGVAYGARECSEKGRITLLSLAVANMDAVLNDQSFQVPFALVDGDESKLSEELLQ